MMVFVNFLCSVVTVAERDAQAAGRPGIDGV